MTLEACRLRVRLGCHCQCEGACWGAAASTAHAYGRAGPPEPMLQGAGEAACESDPSPTAGTQGSAACAVYKPEVRVWHSRRIQGSKRALDLPTAQHIYRRLFSFGFRFRFGFRVRVNRVFWHNVPVFKDRVMRFTKLRDRSELSCRAEHATGVAIRSHPMLAHMLGRGGSAWPVFSTTEKRRRECARGRAQSARVPGGDGATGRATSVPWVSGHTDPCTHVGVQS